MALPGIRWGVALLEEVAQIRAPGAEHPQELSEAGAGAGRAAGGWAVAEAAGRAFGPRETGSAFCCENIQTCRPVFRMTLDARGWGSQGWAGLGWASPNAGASHLLQSKLRPEAEEGPLAQDLTEGTMTQSRLFGGPRGAVDAHPSGQCCCTPGFFSAQKGRRAKNSFF